jgi:SAM-dependent methyltransferase
MSPEDPLLNHEFDQFQRYHFLRRILETAYLKPPKPEKVRLLDVGSGPERLTATFLDDRFDVVRCDVESFGQDDIVVIDPNDSYPFSAEEFDVVVALEVLEHVKATDRTHLLDETLRVARDLVILSIPDGRSEVVAAEGRIAAAFQLMTGQPHPFLREHFEHGLPTEQEVRALLDGRGLPYSVRGNSPLDRWEAFLMLDQVLRTVQDGPELASELYRHANAETSPGAREAGFYRNFYVVGKDEQAFARARETMEHEVSGGASSDLADPGFQLAQVVASMLSKSRFGLQAAERLRTYERDAEELTQELELVRSALTTLFFGLDSPRATRVIRSAKRLLSGNWQNHPFAAEPTGRLANVLSGGHSLWCAFGPDAHLTIRGEFPPGRYRLNARTSAINDAALVGSIDKKTYKLGNVASRSRALSKEIVIDDVADEIHLAFDRPVAFAAIGDLHIVRHVEESRVVSIARNAAAVAGGRRELRWFAHLRMAQPIVRRLRPPLLAGGPQPSDYEGWISQRLEERAKSYPRPRKEVPLSILTTVWNTPALYLERLAQSVSMQKYREYEWILLDNGSTDAETIATTAAIGRRERVRLERVGENLGIIGGMHRCLERASGRYVLPVDSDDYLYPDAFRILCHQLVRAGYPSLAYSDEDKLWEERFLDAYLKPDWDPVLFLNSCYIAHLCAIDRARAIELGVYTDEDAEGCHDWDTFMRFMLAGHEPLHIPEVLYSWRMHPESAALNIASKAYLDASHRHVLGKFIAAQADSDRYDIVRSPLWGPTPDWWFVRRPVESRPIVGAFLVSHRRRLDAAGNDFPVLVSGRSAELRQIAERAYAKNALVQLLWDQVDVMGDDWTWEVLALTELHSDIVMVGGRVHDSSNRIVAAGEYLGFGGACGCPDVGRSLHEPGYFGQMWKQRSVSAVSTMLAVCESSFLLEALEAIPGETPIPFLGAWLGAYAARADRRVVYTPFLTGRCRSSRTTWDALIHDTDRHAFAAANADLIPDTRYLSPLLSLDPATPYAPTSGYERERILARFGYEGVRDSAQAFAARP